MMKSTDIGKDPQREQLLARKAALLVAAGKSDRDICGNLGCSPAALAILRKSPLFEESIANYVDELETTGLATIVADLEADWPTNRDFIKRVRDGNFDEPKDKVQLRLQAAKMLLDKQAPNADSRQANKDAAKLIIDGRLLGQALRALKNVGVLDVTAEDIAHATGEAIPQLIARTPEAFAETYVPEAEVEE